MREREIVQALAACAKMILEGSKPLDPDFAEVVDEEFWNLLRKPKISDKKILKTLGDACDLLDIHMCNRANHGNMERTYALWKDKSNEEIMNELWEIYNEAS